MSAIEKEYTIDEIKLHDSKKDLWVVIHDKVYAISSFVDEHPGGEEVLMDVGGQDATDSFEDVGHSDEAREILDKLFVGKLKRSVWKQILETQCADISKDNDPKPKSVSVSSSQQVAPTDAGTTFYALFFLAALVAFGSYKYIQGA